MEYLDSYSRDNLGDIDELQLQNMWVLEMPFAGKNFDLYVQSVSFPNFGISLDKTKFDLVFPDGKAPYGDVEIAFYDSVQCTYINMFTNWIHSVYNFKNFTFSKNFHNLKKTATLRLLSPINKGVIANFGTAKAIDTSTVAGSPFTASGEIDPNWALKVKTAWVTNKSYVLEGLQIQSISDYTLNDSGDPIEFSVTMSVQNVYMVKGDRDILAK